MTIPPDEIRASDVSLLSILATYVKVLWTQYDLETQTA
jgi:hypothetical protein